MGDIDPSKPGSAFDWADFGYTGKNARVGDWIRRETTLPSLTGKQRYHHGVVVLVDDDEVYVYDLQMGEYRAVTLAEFAEGKLVTVVQKGIPGQEEAVFERAKATTKGGRGWSLQWTCEDAAAYVHDGASTGKQGKEETDAAYEWGKAFASKYLK